MKRKKHQDEAERHHISLQNHTGILNALLAAGGVADDATGSTPHKQAARPFGRSDATQ
ncbi:hypothetical protein MNEG_11282, partial [Monoraphidium neglectum]